MAGIGAALRGEQQQAPQQAAPQGLGQAEPKAPGIERQQASPELQAVYNRFVGLCMAMLWSDRFMSQASKIIQEHPDETDAMAMIGAAVVQRVYMAADQQGEPVPPEVLLHGGLEVMNEVATFAQAAGVQGIEPDEIETAFFLAADKVRAALEQAGKINPDEMAEQFEELRAMVGDDVVSATEQKLSGARQKTQDAILARGRRGQQQPQQGAQA